MHPTWWKDGALLLAIGALILLLDETNNLTLPSLVVLSVTAGLVIIGTLRKARNHGR